MEEVSEKPPERPIIFRAENVRAIIARRKSQARRVVRLPLRDPASGREVDESFLTTEGLRLCPYGKTGDRLWVRETITRRADGHWHYSADHSTVQPREPLNIVPLAVMSPYLPADMYPSTVMPRWAARLMLEITDIRIQRLQSMSIEDAVAEAPSCWACGGPIDGSGRKGCVCFNSTKPARASFALLWESFHEQSEPWASNPFVWVITFKLVTSNVLRIGPPATAQAACREAEHAQKRSCATKRRDGASETFGD